MPNESTGQFSRVIPFEGVQNFRDLGGYETKDGRKMKRGLFFRSAQLSQMTDKDKQLFEQLGIKTIVDFRTDKESTRSPNPSFENVLMKRLPPITDLKTVVRSVDDMSGEELIRHLHEGSMDDFYQSIIFDNDAYKNLMEMIQDPNHLGLLQHCTAGKDRTGIGSALILLALDVPEETVLQDYLLSNNHLSKVIGFMQARLASKLSEEELKLVKPFMSVKEDYLKNVFRVIKKEYQSYDVFFEHEFQLTKKKRETLKNFCLE